MYKIIFLLIISAFALISNPTLQAQRFDAPSLAQRGSYAVGTFDATIEDGDGERDLKTTIWYPAVGEETIVDYDFIPLFSVLGRAIPNGDPVLEEAPFPLVVFSHGNGGSRVLGLFITEHLASHGFIVIAADHPQNDVQASLTNNNDFVSAYAQRPIDVLRQINYATDVLNAPEGFLAGLIDTDNIGVMGHSFGGLTALLAGGGRLDFEQLDAFCRQTQDDGVCFLQSLEADIAAARGLEEAPDELWDATTDPRIRAIAAFAPWNAPILNVDEITVPTLIAVGDSDLITPPERDAFTIYDRLAAPRSLVTFNLAGHNIFVDICPEVIVTAGAEDVCTDPVWDMQRAHDITNHITTAFFSQHLKRNSEVAALLRRSAIDFTGIDYQVGG